MTISAEQVLTVGQGWSEPSWGPFFAAPSPKWMGWGHISAPCHTRGSCSAPRAGAGAARAVPAAGRDVRREHRSLLPREFPAPGIPCPGHSPGAAWGREQSNPHAGIWHPPNSSFPHTNTHCRNMVTLRTWNVRWGEVCPQKSGYCWNLFQFILLCFYILIFTCLPFYMIHSLYLGQLALPNEHW